MFIIKYLKLRKHLHLKYLHVLTLYLWSTFPQAKAQGYFTK